MGKIAFWLRNLARAVDVSEWKEVLKICSKRAKIREFRFHDLRHTFASWYMMNGGDLYELAKILGHSNIKMTERYAKLGRKHVARTGNTAREIWKMMQSEQSEGAYNLPLECT